MTNDRLTDVQCFKKAKEAEQNDNVGQSINYYRKLLNDKYEFVEYSQLTQIQNICKAHENIARLEVGLFNKLLKTEEPSQESDNGIVSGLDIESKEYKLIVLKKSIAQHYDGVFVRLKQLVGSEVWLYGKKEEENSKSHIDEAYKYMHKMIKLMNLVISNPTILAGMKGYFGKEYVHGIPKEIKEYIDLIEPISKENYHKLLEEYDHCGQKSHSNDFSTTALGVDSLPTD